jgi:crotonobetainyl-CoA:carnitine CoA-transferase CaiB-like acyl-CoA transferase
MLKLLNGTKIIDLTHMLAGPYGSLLLGDLGAEIIKIEEPAVGDRTRLIGPPFVHGQSAYFISVNRNKMSVTLNLKNAKGRELFLRLVEKADVVYDNFKPGTLENLGIGYEEQKKHNPAIIACSITAFGENSPYRDLPAFDLSIQAMSGTMSFTGEPGRPPVRMGLPMGDLAGGMMAAFAISGALYAREKTGIGTRISISLVDCQLSLLTYVAQYYFCTGALPQPIGSAHQSVVPYQAFKTRDIYLVVAVFVEKYWERLCQVLGLTELIRDPRFDSNSNRAQNREALIPVLEARFLQKSGQEWIDALRQAEVPSAPINTLDKILNDPYVTQQNMVIETEHPSYGKVKSVGNPIKLEQGEEAKDAPASLLGEQTEAVLQRYLGLSSQEIENLRKEAVI